MPVIPPILLLENECYRVERQLSPSYLRVTRSAVPFRSLQHCNVTCSPVQRVLDQMERRVWPLLIDSRLAVGRNDEEYESWFSHHRRAMLLGFPRVCILMRTAIGKLHAERMFRREGTLGNVTVSLDEGEAVRWLVAAPSASARTFSGAFSLPTVTESTPPSISVPPVSMRRVVRRDRENLSSAPPTSTSSWTTDGIAIAPRDVTVGEVSRPFRRRSSG